MGSSVPLQIMTDGFVKSIDEDTFENVLIVSFSVPKRLNYLRFCMLHRQNSGGQCIMRKIVSSFCCETLSYISLERILYHLVIRSQNFYIYACAKIESTFHTDARSVRGGRALYKKSKHLHGRSLLESVRITRHRKLRWKTNDGYGIYHVDRVRSHLRLQSICQLCQSLCEDLVKLSQPMHQTERRSSGRFFVAFVNQVIACQGRLPIFLYPYDKSCASVNELDPSMWRLLFHTIASMRHKISTSS